MSEEYLAKQADSEKKDLINQLNNRDHWERIDSGITNFNYSLKLTQQSFFIQVLDSEKLKRLPSKQFVPVNLVMKKNASLAKWLVPCLYETQKLRVFDWVDAENTSADIFSNKEMQQELLKFLSVLHSSISVLPILDINQHIEHYYQLAITNNPSQKEKFKSLYLQAIDCARHFIPSKNCHNDLSPGNILYARKNGQYRMYIIDWEYACISDPFFDLAGICINFGLSETQEKKLIQNYSENLSLYPSLDKFNKMKELYQIISLLWNP